MSDHKYKVGQLVNYLARERASGVYQVTQLMPLEGEAFQYRIKNANEPHERHCCPLRMPRHCLCPPKLVSVPEHEATIGSCIT